ncbi:hypothetical protein Dacet_0728 [Denitrovibrio acetiphilus DSM 12809]|uniref:Uncharacterized protein n=1 Tax=Denitrovibrio acetiphilus (strain DSM 12809 / NBRC 114555 / N2460) TaxID=522772 RepID=D4H4W8_DENA2|nr:hypothetical protein [Denitrovibrio acetiphilus]ADD67512.1 hypothetical protein Dacet_0728 [Denitrovibrio acetiphilus DSM 12809]
MRFEADNMFKPTWTYDDYIESLKIGESCEYREERTVSVCNELIACIDERIVYSDRKIFDQNGRYYKPTDIVVTGNRARPQFNGLLHVEMTVDRGSVLIPPIKAVELMSAFEGFVGNSLSLHKEYRQGCFTFSVVKKNEIMNLCVDYGHGLKKSYMDKCYCRLAASVLRTILSNCDFWL